MIPESAASREKAAKAKAAQYESQVIFRKTCCVLMGTSVPSLTRSPTGDNSIRGLLRELELELMLSGYRETSDNHRARTISFTGSCSAGAGMGRRQTMDGLARPEPNLCNRFEKVGGARRERTAWYPMGGCRDERHALLYGRRRAK